VSGNGKFAWRSAHTFRVLLAVGCVCAGSSARATATPFDFGKTEIGAGPAKLDLAQEQWTAVRDATAETGIAAEQSAVRTDDRYPLAISETALIRNAEINLRLKTAGGKPDQGGGVAVRLSNPRNYYLVQVDAQRDRVAFSLVSNGASEEIVGVDADIASHSWHTLTVRAIDNEFTVSLDGEWLFTAFDKTLSQAGRVGFWPKSDSNTQFDQIEIAPLP
jgi:hypothetical protein